MTQDLKEKIIDFKLKEPLVNNHEIKDRINETYLCILKYQNNELITNFIKIENYFLIELDYFTNICDQPLDNLSVIADYLRKTESLKLLEGKFKFCEKLDRPYQGLTIDFEEEIESILQNKNLFQLNLKNDEKYDFNNSIKEYKLELNNRFKLWICAYNIEKAYQKCKDNKSILTFSHRINGWSNPEHKLSENFSIELKTNFGYGNASYFFIKIKYKNIEITPFSEWINYEIAEFSEIIRYTKSFATRVYKRTYNGRRYFGKKIENSNWLEAIEFAKTACNTSIKDEAAFVKIYILKECEIMVKGLEYIYSNHEFTFKENQEINYKVDKSGHQLMEFRGEKISGALAFISKILEFELILEVKSFINRIEKWNRKIQPLLEKELDEIAVKYNALLEEFKILEPKFISLEKRNKTYSREIYYLEKEFYYNNKKAIDQTILNNIIQEKFPEHKEFEEEFKKVSLRYKQVNEDMDILDELYNNIENYNNTICDYFEE